MILRCRFALLFTSVAVPAMMPAQSTGPASGPDSDSPGLQEPAERAVSWKLLLPNILSDQGRIWSFPARIAREKNWIPTTAIMGTAAGLIALDPAEAGYFRRASAFQSFNNVFTGNATAAGTIAVPIALYALGRVRKDSKMTHTALLAGEAVADVEAVTTVLKDATGRIRPAAIPPGGHFSDTWFEDRRGSFLRGSGSFPSGHTIAAFSVATVISRRYSKHRWVPYAAYGMAALVGFSRLSLSSHFVSDVFAGAALGYSISRFAVLRQ